MRFHDIAQFPNEMAYDTDMFQSESALEIEKIPTENKFPAAAGHDIPKFQNESAHNNDKLQNEAAG